jgi:hypothetical protein
LCAIIGDNEFYNTKCGFKYEGEKKVKQSRYRPGVAQRVPGSYGSQIT